MRTYTAILNQHYPQWHFARVTLILSTFFLETSRINTEVPFMSQKTSAKLSTPSSSDLSINPVLQGALASLDVQLEAELTRYRRQRRGRTSLFPQMPPYNSQQPPTTQEATTGTPVSHVPTTNPGNSAVQPNQASLKSKPTQTDTTKALTLASSSQEAVLATTEDTTATDSKNPEEPLAADNQLVIPTPDQSEPQDYLESSEKLRQSLAAPETTKNSQKPLTNRIFTPLGIGSILLLLVSTTTLTYIFRTSLGLEGFLETQTPKIAENSAQTTSKGENDSLIGLGRPDLTSDEFPDVNIHTLSNLKASPTPSPEVSPIAPMPNPPAPEAAPPRTTVLPLPQLPNPASNLPGALLAPSSPQRATPPTVTPKVTPTPAESLTNPSSETANPSSSSSSNSPSPTANSNLSNEFYYVLINGSDSNALEKARTIIPDAYIVYVSGGAKISAGAFKLESEAKTLVEQLKQQGFPASVYKP